MAEEWNDYLDYDKQEPLHEDTLLSEGLPCNILNNTGLPGYRVEPHWHEAAELLYMIEGTIRLVINGSVFIMEPGDLAAVGPLDVHTTIVVAGTPARSLVLQFDLSSWDDIRKYDTSSNISMEATDNRITGPSGQRIYEYMEAVKAMFPDQHSRHFALKGYIYLIMDDLYRRYPAWGRNDNRSRDLLDRLHGFNRVLATINADPVSPPTLPEAALLAGMSAPSFSLFFKRKLGKGFIDYIHEVRLRHAARLILETKMLVGDIAYQSGFNSLNFFNKIFRRHYGVTPLQYRNRYPHRQSLE